MGAILPGNWLPLLPNGTSLGPRPAALADRYSALYKTFAEAWRVTSDSSLFDSIAGMPAPCVPAGWPATSGPCVVAESPPASAISLVAARALCGPIRLRQRRANCVFDLRATGHRGFARTYRLSERIEQSSTITVVSAPSDSSRPGKPITFGVVVVSKFTRGRPPRGQVHFLLNGKRVGDSLALDAQGRALWKAPILEPGSYVITAEFVPTRGSSSLRSSSAAVHHIVAGQQVR